MPAGSKRKATSSGFSRKTKAKFIRKGPYTRKRYRYGVKGKGKIAKICRDTIIRMSEAKDKTYNHGKIEMYHNSGSPASGQILNSVVINGTTIMPTQGSGDSQRNGDRINVSGFSVKMLVGAKFDRPNVTWRFLVVSLPKGTGPTLGTVLVNSTSNILLDSVNTDLCTVLYQKYWKPQRSTLFSEGGGVASTNEFTVPFQFWIPRKREYKFSADGGTTHNDNDIHLVLFAYDAYGTVMTANIGYVQLWVKMFYRDP